MKVGDLVRYDPDRYDDDPPNMGVIVKLYRTWVVNGEHQRKQREMVDVLWCNGIWTDDSYEFTVVQ